MLRQIPHVPAAVLRICETLEANGFGAWIVGGCVRDSLMTTLGLRLKTDLRPETDWDIATSARPEQVQALFPRVIPTGIDHGTVTVVLSGAHYEVTTLRSDVGYSDGRRPDRVEFVADITEDLARRDFTINAVAYDVKRDELIDPFSGIEDLKARRLRAVGNAAERFAEDGLRVLRAARFSATLELSFDPATLQAIRPSLGSYCKVSVERIRDEWTKAFKARQPSRAFEIMREHGMLEITTPALFNLAGQPLSAASAQDLWQHAMRSLDLAPKRLPVQLAALFHRVAQEDSATSANEIATRSAALCSKILTQLRFSNKDREHATRLIALRVVDYDVAWSAADVRRWLASVVPTPVADIFELMEVSSSAEDASEPELHRIREFRQRAEQELTNHVPLTLGDLAISGKELMSELGLAPGRQLGELLKALLERVLENPSLNTKPQLLLEARAALRPGT